MIFVTGASGLIGSFICRKLVDEGYTVKALKRPSTELSLLNDIKDKIQWIDGDLVNVTETENYLEGVHKVIHCAALVSYDQREEELIYQTNVEGTANLVNAALLQNVELFVHLSSVASIGKEKHVKVSTEETHWTEGENVSTYARSKHQSELEVWRGWAEGLNTIIINPSLVLGPGNWHKSSTQVFKYVYEERSFYTTGIVNYVDVRDVAEVTVRLMNSDLKGERFILNSGNVSYKELFDKIAAAMQKTPPGIRVGSNLIKAAIIFEKIRSKLSGNKPLVTDELKTVSKNQHCYANDKIKGAVDIDFRKLEDTVNWTCEQLLKEENG